MYDKIQKKKEEKIISGIIFKGSIYIDENNIIYDIKKKNVNSNFWIVPKFINLHTHIGDSVIKDPKLGKYNKYSFIPNLDSLIKPPNGLKHKALSIINKKKLLISMKNTINDLYSTGISTIVDFREGGTNGIKLIKQASKASNIKTIILSRPKNNFLEQENIKKEIKKIIDLSDGFGVSGYNDIDENIIYEMRKIANQKNKIFAIHSGEKDKSDIDDAISLNPDMIIHLTNATSKHLKKIKDRDIPVVICPRSNIITGVGFPPVKKMMEYDICLGLGTDNIMLNSPNMFEEMNILFKLFKLNEKTIYSILTKNSERSLSIKSSIIEVGNPASLMILNSKSYNLSCIFNPLSGFIRRARVDDIIKII